MRVRSPALVAAFLMVGVTTALPKAKNPKTYPEHGTVLAMRTTERSYTTGVYTDPQGKTHGGNSYSARRPVYRIETEKMFYELEGTKKEQLPIGGTVDFRIEKDKAYIQRGDKEDKFRVVGVELKPK
jgi:hypothetical protein